LQGEAYREGGAGEHVGGVHDVCRGCVSSGCWNVEDLLSKTWSFDPKFAASSSDAKMLTTPKHE
jgi:hypothetical protein